MAHHTIGLRERKKELAFERGLEKVTRDEIAAGPNVSLRTFNNYFSNKFEAVAYRQIERMRRILRVFQERPVDEPLWSAITERTRTDAERDIYPRLVAAVMRAVFESAIEAYTMADPPVHITDLLRRGFADVAAGLPER
jgi:AcrR family transcriptional regulator